jgi:polyhydroxyalkanoate synthesis repressor PhaR
MPILIKRYANRKLYNTKTSRYITLKGIAELLDEGEEVRVIDNETGEDITSVALSQILVDNERTNTRPSQGLLSQIMERGGDALYDALKKGVGDATDRFGELEDRFRGMLNAEDEARRHAQGQGEGEGQGEEDGTRRSEREHKTLSDWIAYSSPDFDELVEKAVERVFRVLDLPRRSDVEALNRNLERVAAVVETLEEAFARHEASSAPPPRHAPEPTPPAPPQGPAEGSPSR